MMEIKDRYLIYFDSKQIGTYYIYVNGEVSFDSFELPEGYSKKSLMQIVAKMPIDANRVPGTRKQIWKSGPITMERIPKDIDKFWIYERRAKKGTPTYSEKSHSMPHREGSRIIEGMEEWANWYCFNKKDDGMFEAELDEVWDGGSHYDGGTIRVEVPEEWLDLPYDEFLEHVITLSAASHYGFTPDDLKKKEGLKAFFGFVD